MPRRGSGPERKKVPGCERQDPSLSAEANDAGRAVLAMLRGGSAQSRGTFRGSRPGLAETPDPEAPDDERGRGREEEWGCEVHALGDALGEDSSLLRDGAVGARVDGVTNDRDRDCEPREELNEHRAPEGPAGDSSRPTPGPADIEDNRPRGSDEESEPEDPEHNVRAQGQAGRHGDQGTSIGNLLATVGGRRYLHNVAATIETRRDLARYLQDQMVASRRNWLATEDDEEELGRTMVKTYLVEAHCERCDEDTLGRLGRAVGFQVVASKDPHLFRFQAPDVEFWCDTSIGRFWRMYTVAPVKAADPVHDQLVASATWLDKVWLPPDYLERLAGLVGARLLTFSLNHDCRPLNRGDGPTTETDFVTMRLWASNAQQQLTKLRDAQIFPHGISLRSVRLRAGSDEPDGDFCVAEYFHYGKSPPAGRRSTSTVSSWPACFVTTAHSLRTSRSVSGLPRTTTGTATPSS